MNIILYRWQDSYDNKNASQYVSIFWSCNVFEENRITIKIFEWCICSIHRRATCLFSSARSIIDGWICITGEMFDDVMIRHIIPITEIPIIQYTSLMRSTYKNYQKYIDTLKTETI